MKVLFLCFVSGLIGHSLGFKSGVESSDFDRAVANSKLINCQEIIYKK